MSGPTKIDKDRLISEHLGLVYHLVSRIHRNLPVRHEYDDLVGYGMLGLIEAAHSYCPSKKTKFSTFAFFRIRGAIYDGISETCWMSRTQYRRHMEVLKRNQSRMKSLDENDRSGLSPSDSADSAEWNYAQAGIVALTPEHADQLEGVEDSVSMRVVQLETETVLCQAIEELPRRENHLIKMVYFEGYSLQDAAERIGVSKSWASRLHQKIIEKLGILIDRGQSKNKMVFTDDDWKGDLSDG